MHRPAASHFQGSTPRATVYGAKIARDIDLSIGACAILFAVAIWGVGYGLFNHPDPTLVLKVSCTVMLIQSGLGLWLMQRAEQVPRFTTARIYEAVFRRLSQDGKLAVQNAPTQGSYRGLADLIGDLALLSRRLQTGRTHAESTLAGNAETLRQARHQVQTVASRVRQDAGTLAETAADIDLAKEHLDREGQAACHACDDVENAVCRATGSISALVDAVRATTDGAERMTTVAVRMSEVAHDTHRCVGDLDDRSATLIAALDHIEHALQVAGSLGHAVNVEAARHAGAGHQFAGIAAELQDVAGSCQPALDAALATMRELGGETREASRRASEIAELVSANREIGGAISHAVIQQGEEIARILTELYEARSGFVTLRAGVDAVTRTSTARTDVARSLRNIAQSMPDQVESLANMLRSIPDFAPRMD